MFLVRVAKILARALRAAALETMAEARQLSTPRKIKLFANLHLGAGQNQLPGWGNIDLIGKNLRWDLTRPLPLKRSIRFVYTEHFIEHVTREDGLSILRSCRSSMAQGGVIRISTPDMRKLAVDYLAGNLIEMEHGCWFPRTPCQMINEGVRNWGHLFIYDESELRLLLEEAGFVEITRQRRMESDHPELRGLETRPDFGDIILEAIAP